MESGGHVELVLMNGTSEVNGTTHLPWILGWKSRWSRELIWRGIERVIYVHVQSAEKEKTVLGFQKPSCGTLTVVKLCSVSGTVHGSDIYVTPEKTVPLCIRLFMYSFSSVRAKPTESYTQKEVMVKSKAGPRLAESCWGAAFYV